MNPYNGIPEGFRSKCQQQRRARVEIIPLIDVMFLLVAFLMVTSISMVVQKGIFVDLASARSSSDHNRDSEVLVISVNQSGELFLNRKTIDEKELLQELEAAVALDKNRSVIINADRDARHGAVISALDLVRQSGLHNIVFSTEPDR